MTEKELDKACEWIDIYSGEIWSAVEYDTPLDELLADFREAMTESERQVTIDGKQYKVKKLKPNYCHCEKCVFGMPCGTNQIETPPCIVHNLDESEYFESTE